jgi:transcriptional regulator with XRE-family HTH domain
MINAHRTGGYISRLRKARDWTQLDLAEKLHVTHQAVSQWEKGAAFPDVSLLPRLARLLGVSVDDLLNGEPLAVSGRLSPGALVEELARGNPAEAARLVKNDPEGVKAMLETAPLARPSHLDEVISHLGGLPFTLRQVVDLAPYVSQEALQTALANVAADQVDAGTVVELAPFVDRDTLDRWAPRIAEAPGGLEALDDLAPFLRSETLTALVQRLLDAGHPLPPERVATLAPFLKRDDLDALLQRLPDGAVAIEHLVELAPFTSRETLDHLITHLDDPSELGSYLEDLAPFLSRGALQHTLANLKGGLTADLLLAVAPFLDRKSLDELLRANKQARSSERDQG